jgi:hypothetical protein
MQSDAISKNGTKRGVSNLRPRYSDDVSRWLRHYALTQDEAPGCLPRFKDEEERDGWAACHRVLKDYSSRDARIIIQLYLPGDTKADKIYEMSKIMRVPQNTLWNLMRDTERKIAQKRGLV